MPKVFISYARSDAEDPLLRRFLNELGDRLAELLNIPRDEAVFLDQRGIQVGAAWEQALSEALGSCQCFVAIVSRAYLASDMCGREWGVFAARLSDQPAGEDAASVLLPVVWQLAPLPREVKRIQWYHADLGARYARAGLAELAHFHPEDYAQFVDSFAEHVHRTVVRLGLPPASERVNLRATHNAFRRGARRRLTMLGGLTTALVGIVLASVGLKATATARSARTEVAQWIEESASSRDPTFLAAPAPAAIDRLRNRDLLELARLALRDSPAATAPLVSRALERMPRSTEAWRLEGERRYRAGAYQEALQAFGRAVSLGGGADAFHWRARAERQLGDIAAYERDLDEACRRGDQGACEIRR